MNIRTKMISLLALLFAVLIVLEIAVQRQVLMPSFAELEREDAETSMKRIGHALDMTLESMESLAGDWGNWADAYQFVQTPNAEFVNLNVTAATMKQLKTNAVLLVDVSGGYLFSSARTGDAGEPRELDLTARKALPEDFPWRKNLADGNPARGLLRTNRGVMMIAAGAVWDGSGGGQALGMVIMGRLLTPAQVQIVGAQAQARLAMLRDHLSASGEEIAETDSATQIFKSFTDVYGKPLMTFRVEVPRRISERGLGAVTYASLYLIGAAVTCLVLLVVVLKPVRLKTPAPGDRHPLAVGVGTPLCAALSSPS